MGNSLNAVREFNDSGWGTEGATQGIENLVEDGLVLHFPKLRFALQPGEERFLTEACSDGKAKNISLRGEAGVLRGASGSTAEQDALRELVARYRDHASSLVGRLFPHYRGRLTRANTSFRPFQVEGRASSWRQDDARLHVDAFPSNPTRGTRLLRVFHNLNPHGTPRVWRLGEPFEAHAQHFLPHIKPPLPGSAWLLNALHVTKAPRTAYDHYMLHLHDGAKADLDYQRNCPQQRVAFQPGATWVVFSDQALHAVMSGQFMLEQTFNLAPEHQLAPDKSPVQVLQRLLGRPLLA